MLNRQVDDKDDAGRRALTKMIMRLFELWRLTYEQQAQLLGLSPKTKSSIAKYKKGELNLPQYRDIQDRITHLLVIHKSLRQIFPENQDLAYQWPTIHNRAFDHMTPVELVCKEGFLGMIRIRKYLERYLAG